ncbi:MAG: hypothetical protein H8E44_44890 [Planctomycetes bacterium]|nr:hypothetical protein [Planctomycetota bacterium]MBL7037223.1 hypothetical protein [Pirellulaceae bacterium]
MLKLARHCCAAVPITFCCLVSSLAVAQEPPTIKVRHVRKLESPLPGAGGNSHLLPGMPLDGPCFAMTSARSYADCTAGFYNAKLELVASWRESIADGDKVMCVTAGDLDGDGQSEIVLSTRQQAPGAYALRWNVKERKLETIWSFLDVRKGPFYRGIEVGDFTSHKGREVCIGGDGSELYLIDRDGKHIATAKIPSPTIQRIDVCDHDDDGYDEMIVSTGRSPGMVFYLKWHPQTYELQTIWRADVTPGGRGGNNCYEALYHPNGHPDGGPAIAVNTEQEAPREMSTGAILMLDMNGRELWRYDYNEDEGRGGACDFADVTGDDRPEIISRYARLLKKPVEVGILILDNRGCRLARVPNVTAGSAGPYVFRPNGPGTKPVYLLATSNVYEILVDDGQ